MPEDIRENNRITGISEYQMHLDLTPDEKYGMYDLFQLTIRASGVDLFDR